MSLRVVRSTDIIQVQHPIFLVVGLPGLGKSSLGYSCENPVVLNTDSESAQARAVNRGNYLDVLTVDALVELEQQGHPMIEEADTIVPDTVGSLIELMKQAIVKDNPKYGYNGNLTQQGWGALKNRFTSFLAKYRSKKNIVLITHAKESEKDQVTFYRPLIDGGARDYVLQQSDFVGFLHMVGKERVLDFNPTDSWHGKNPGQWPAFTIPRPEQARTFMKQLFERGRAALGQISAVSATVANQVQDWASDIETYTTVEEFNRAIPKIQKLNATLKPQVTQLLFERAKQTGVTYDNTNKVFLMTMPQKETLVTL